MGRYSSRKRRSKKVILIAAGVIALVAIVGVGVKFAFAVNDTKDDPTPGIEDIKKEEGSVQTGNTEDPKTDIPEVTPPTPPVEPVEPAGPAEAATYESAVTEAGGKLASLEFDYQGKYDGLYAKKKDIVDTGDKKMVYLTFDDGPSGNTADVLDELDKYGIKATFFVVDGGKDPEVAAERMREIVKRGHTIAIHTNSHEYKKIYASVDAFLADMDAINRFVYEATGVRPNTYRFPGGSVNNFNKSVRFAIDKEMSRRGFKMYDWNASTQDAEGKKFTPHQLAENAISTFSGRKRVVVLAHDGAGQKNTAQAVGEIYEYAVANGYSFGVLDGTVSEVMFLKREG